MLDFKPWLRFRLGVLLLCAANLLLDGVSQAVEKKVLMIGIDGAGGQYVEAANTPHLDALAADGGIRYDYLNEGALVVDPPSGYGASGVNWSTFVTGASAANHGVVDNSFGGNEFANHPHFFKHVKEFDPSLRTVSLANWTPINQFILPDQYADVEIGYDAGSLAQQDKQVKQDAVTQLAFADPDVMFLHLDQVDGAGHAFSWGSLQHTLAIETVDNLVGQVIQTLNDRPGVVSGEEDWLVLVSADHGATPGSFSHFASQGPDNWEVPFIVSGRSVRNGVALKQGTLRDLATTALLHLGVDPFVAGLDGFVRGILPDAPSGVPGDLNNDGVLSGDGLGPAASDDVTTFLDNWLVEGAGSVPDRYGRGDVNLDGVTDLSDWALINREFPPLGAAIARAIAGVPEPASAAMLFAALFVLPTRNRR